MYVKVTTSGSCRYVKLIESYRDDAGRVKKRTVLPPSGAPINSAVSLIQSLMGCLKSLAANPPNWCQRYLLHPLVLSPLVPWATSGR